MENKGPLADIRVIDLTQAMAGPMATMTLGDLGAEVIKIEPPSGDQTRSWAPPYISGMSSYFLSANRNKKSIVLDLKTQDGKDILEKMITSADVLIENFRPGTMERLGLSYDKVHEINRRIIYCSLSGYGQTGPSRDWPGYDLTVLAYSGLLSLNAEEGRPPIKFGVPIADITAGLFAAISIISAIRDRDHGGSGQFIDMSMLDANFSILTHQAMAYFATGQNPKHLGSAHASISPYQVFPTSDGYLAMAVGTQKLWIKFCEIMERRDLMENELFTTNVDRVKNRAILAEEITKVFSEYRTEDLFRKLLDSGIPATPINTVEQAVRSPQILERGMISSLEAPYGRIPVLGTPFNMSRTPGSIRLHPPMLGENTAEILRESGYSQKDIESLASRGIINRDVRKDS